MAFVLYALINFNVSLKIRMVIVFGPSLANWTKTVEEGGNKNEIT